MDGGLCGIKRPFRGLLVHIFVQKNVGHDPDPEFANACMRIRIELSESRSKNTGFKNTQGLRMIRGWEWTKQKLLYRSSYITYDKGIRVRWRRKTMYSIYLAGGVSWPCRWRLSRAESWPAAWCSWRGTAPQPRLINPRIPQNMTPAITSYHLPSNVLSSATVL